MARDIGLFKLSGNFEIEYAGPIDPRNRRATKDELFLENTWVNSNNTHYLYNGMPVIIYNDPIQTNNGLYILLNKDLYTQESSWLFIGKEKNSIFAGVKLSSIDAGDVGDMSITDDYLYICVLSGTAGNAIWKRIPLFATT